MKKFWKIIFVFALFITCSSIFFACDDGNISSISLSINSNDATYSATSRSYTVLHTSAKIPLVVSVVPNSYSAKNLTWHSSANNVAYVTNDGNMITVDEGNTLITASFKNPNGTTISATLRVFVEKEILPTFASHQSTTTYKATDLTGEEFCKVQNENDQKYKYVYYHVSNGQIEEVEGVCDAGSYIIKYVRRDNPTVEIDEKTLVVEKATINLSAPNHTSVYGDLSNSTDAQVFYPQGESVERKLEIKSNLGKDNNVTIGHYAFTTTATNSSHVGKDYVTQVNFLLDQDYASNYQVVTTSGKHAITPRHLFVMLNSVSTIYGNNVEASADYSIFDIEDFIEDKTQINMEKALNKSFFVAQNDIVSKELHITKHGAEKATNEYGYYDVLPNGEEYQMTFENIITSNNIVVERVVPNSLIISPLDCTVTPANASKVHTEKDPDSFLFSINISDKFKAQIGNAISIKYGSNYGEGNKFAPAGNYFYTLNNSNPNFNLILNRLAQDDGSGSAVYMFQVKKCNVEVQFEDLTLTYVEPNSASYKATYYTQSETFVDFELNIKTFKVNGQNKKSSISTDFEHDGKFVMVGENEDEQKEEISFNLIVGEKSGELGNHFKILTITPEEKFENEFIEKNYNIVALSSIINLDKIKLKVRPTQQRSSTYGDHEKISTFLNSFCLIDDKGKIVNHGDIFVNTNGFLTFEQDGTFEKRSGNTIEFATTMNNCGDYKLFVNPNGAEYVAGVVDCHAFELEEEIFYSITPFNLQICPTENNSKTYGNSDGEIGFEIVSLSGELPSELNGTISELRRDGKLSGSLARERGENAGLYAINSIGTLSFGTNYNLTLDTSKFFEITQRTLLIKPYSVSATYGSDFPTRPVSIGDFEMRVEGNFNSSILEYPSISHFSGKFMLGDMSSTTQIEKQAGYYNAGTYKIVFGDSADSFVYQGYIDENNKQVLNYNIVLDGTSTCTIEKKDAYLDIISTNLPSYPDSEMAQSLWGWDNSSNANKFTISGLVGSGFVEQITFEVATNQQKSVIYVANLKSVLIEKTNINLTANYNIMLGNTTIYYVGTEVVKVKIVAKNNTSTNLVEHNFDGTIQNANNLFDIEILNNNFVLANEHVAPLKFTSTAELPIYEDGLEVKHAGNYVVTLDLSENSKLVLNKLDSYGQPIKENDVVVNYEFSALNTVFGTYMIELTSQGYMKINKSNILVDLNAVCFDNAMTYRDTSLPNLKTTTDIGDPIYYYLKGGVRQKTTLNVDQSTNLNFKQLNAVDASTMPVGTHNIEVVVSAAAQKLENSGNKFEHLPSDFNSKTIAVCVEVNKKVIEVEINSIVLSASHPTELSYVTDYSSSTVSWQMDITATKDNEQILPSNYSQYFNQNYLFKYLETAFENSATGMLVCYQYNNLAIELSQEKQYVNVENVSKICGSLSNDDGYQYVLIETTNGSTFAVRVDTSKTRIADVGVYLCTSQIVLDNNYATTENSNAVTSLSTSHLLLINKKDLSESDFEATTTKFYYGTTFDLLNKSATIEQFGIFMTPDLTGYLQFSSPSLASCPQVGSYSLEISFTQESGNAVKNYFFNKIVPFEVQQCRAEIIFPTGTNEFVFTSSSISAFLDGVSVALIDVNSNVQTLSYNTIVATYATNPFTEHYTNLSTNQDFVATAEHQRPYETGQYRLTMTYNYGFFKTSDDETFSYDYTIIKKQYSGKIRAVSQTIDYNPLVTTQEMYNLLYNSLSIDDENVVNESEIKIYYEEIDENNEISLLSSNWLQNVMSATGKKQIIYVIPFFDENTASKAVASTLTVKKQTLSPSMFSLKSGNSNITEFNYTGLPRYQGIAFAGIDLSPYAPSTQQVNGANYTIQTTHISNNPIYTVVLRDSLSHEVVKITYSYTKDGVDEDPIKPNSAQNSTYKVQYSFGEVDNYICYVGYHNGMFVDTTTTTASNTRNFTIKSSGTLFLTTNVLNFEVENAEAVSIETIGNSLIKTAKTGASTNVEDVKVTVNSTGSATGSNLGVILNFTVFSQSTNTSISSSEISSGTYYIKVWFDFAQSNISNFKYVTLNDANNLYLIQNNEGTFEIPTTIELVVTSKA